MSGSAIMLQNFQRLPLQKKVLFREPRNKRLFHLHCTLLGGGHEALHWGDEYFFDGLKRGNHYFCNLQLCLAGRGEMIQSDDWREYRDEFRGERTRVTTPSATNPSAEQLYSLEPGMLFLTQVPQNHRYYLPKTFVSRK